ncbi:MAG: hypothetical protein IJ727_12840 [Treponema sp.]|nr:hypothetical protein [Treponema sp.]
MTEDVSEDYALLLNYKKNPSKELSRFLSRFFFDKYRQLIDFYCGKYLYELGFESEKERNHFRAVVRYKYIPQALKSFKPEKIEGKKTYIFAKYFYLYLKHAKRDLIHKIRKQMCQNKAEADSSAHSPEDFLIEEINKEAEKRLIEKAKKQLSPLQKEILAFLESGKKQCEIKITNPKTGSFYSKGYISKEIAKIRKTVSICKNKFMYEGLESAD